jgi:hypothetical protein
MIELKLTVNQLNELYKKGYTLEIAYILKMLKSEQALLLNTPETSYHPKLLSIFDTLDRKGLISSGNITMEGEELLKFIDSIEESPKLVKLKSKVDNFDLWWKAYPSTDSFDYKGRHFPGTRSLKAKKDDCKLKLNKILNEGQYTIEELIKAIELEVHQKKENSIKTGQNKLSFFQNSMTYLNQYTYESYVELVRKGQKITETSILTGGTDI